MRTHLRSLLVAVLVAAGARRAAATDPIRVLATDARGLTLQVTAEAWSLTAPDPTGRVHIVGVPEARSLADPGHALLPAYSAMLTVPADARPTARIVSAAGSSVRDGVHLAIAARPVFAPDGHGRFEPTVDAVPALRDGNWPTAQVQLGTPTSFRGRRLVGIEVRPFQYDEVTGRLTVTPTLVVRVDFNRGSAGALGGTGLVAPDPHVDETLRSSVLNFDQGASWRVAPRESRAFASAPASAFAAAAGAIGFDESHVEVRVRIDTTGLYALPYELLHQYGYPDTVSTRLVSVHRHEYRVGAGTPYGTIELPVEVDDANGDGKFDAGDRIWLYARTWAERSGVGYAQRFWGDGDVVFATITDNGGARVPQRAGWRGATGLTQLPSYPLFTHWEHNPLDIMPFVAQPTDTSYDLYHWTDYTLYYSRPDTIQFTVNDIDTTHSVFVKSLWMGRKYTPHFAWEAVENPQLVPTTVVDSMTWFGKMPSLDSMVVHGSALGNGVNRLFTWAKTEPVPPDPNTNFLDYSAFDWFETTYWRRYVAIHDRLEFNSGDATGVFELNASGFLADTTRIWDVTDPDSPVRLTIDPAHYYTGNVPSASFDLQDVVTAGQRRSYVAAVVQSPPVAGWGPRVPPASAFSRVTRQPLYASGGGDYLVVTPSAFVSALQPLLSLRASQGLSVLVAPIEQVYDEFNGGRPSPWAIRRFTQWAYAHWQSRFLLLAGHGSLDPLNHRGLADADWIPVVPTPGPVTTSDGYEITVSDNAYGCLTGNCDAISGGGDVIPELMIGRLPVNDVGEATALVDKLVRYENLSGDPAWRRHVLLLSDDAFSGDTFFGGGGVTTNAYCRKDYERHFEGLNDKIGNVIQFEAGLSQTNVELFNLRDYLAREDSTVDVYGTVCRDRDLVRQHTHASVTPQLFSHINSGTVWVNYQGHANEYVLTHEDLYINGGDQVGSDDKWSFANTDQPFFWTAFSCHSNMFARGNGGEVSFLGGCIGEDMVRLPQRGAVAAWASDCYEVVPRDDSTHINVELSRKLFRDPPHDATLSDHGARVVLGEAIQAAYLDYLPSVSTYGFERGLAVTYTLLGDPATRMSVGRPQSIVYANDLPVTDQQVVRLHTPGDTLTLVADLVSTVRLDSLWLWDGSSGSEQLVPAARYSIAPAYPDTVGGGVYGGRRFRLTYGTHTRPATYDYRYRVKDRDGLVTDFVVAFSLDATLRVDGAPIHDGDDVSPIANLTATLLSPAPIDPATDVTITVNGVSQAFRADSAAGEHSGREWTLSWTHPEYPKDGYVVNITVRGSTVTRTFKVSLATGDLKIANLFAFPNPFDNDGTYFSFMLQGSDPADVRISVFTISGRRIWSDVWHGLAPGYHQIPWNGNDAEGSSIANGVYFYRLNATTTTGRHADQLGRIVKLRKPRHVDIAATP